MTFEAKYGGRCGVCDGRINPGDWIAYSEDCVVHEDCEASAKRVERQARPICDMCWMEIAANGKCGCDE